MKVVISSGHGKHIRGARGNPVPPQCDEVDEVRKVVDRTAVLLRELGVETIVFHDNTSKDQSTNLSTIVNFHNAQGAHDYDVSVHCNAFDHKAHGCEVLYKTQEKLAKTVVDKICSASGLTNRGPKYRDDLKFLNSTREKAILVETMFCDHTGDCNTYRDRFDAICSAIAEGIVGKQQPGPTPEPEPPSGVLFSTSGTCSTFGGPGDTSGMSDTEGLAFITDVMQVPQLFLPEGTPGTVGMGLARRLNPWVNYVACRWDYSRTPKSMLRDSGQLALVTAKKTGVSLLAIPSDWGPHEEQTGRAADLSPALMRGLGIETDDEVSVIYPSEGDAVDMV
jgi:hypothetical protein